MKKIIIAGILMSWIQVSHAQINWQNKDLQRDSVFGISTEKTYNELLKNRPFKTVIVAVIDGGIDTAHVDLRQVLWINPKEKVKNGKDDDHNGFVDDKYGWNFIGGKKGNVQFDNLELTRVIRKEMKFGDSLSMILVPEKDRSFYQAYFKMRKEFDVGLYQAKGGLFTVEDFKTALDYMVKKIGKINPGLADFQEYVPNNPTETDICKKLIRELTRQPNFSKWYADNIQKTYDHFKEEIDFHYNLDYNSRPLVGDNYSDAKQHFYGNNDVMGPDAHHGTHVAGIIGAVRNNNIGIDGVANDVRIMTIRAVPNGDERDKDIANAIRYAVDNGAKVINMSFGKPYSPNKNIVDDAVKYAMSKDVLLIHAAGNDGLNLDKPDNVFYPTRYYLNKTGIAANWIEVGASGQKNDSTLVADFSNYGKTKVDVFAPGVQIYSTTPDSHYDTYDGTSMAAPMVTGLAALIREYYPKLSAGQVKDIIIKSVVKIDHKVFVRGEKESIPFSDVCVSGGVVNAYNALKLAGTY